MDLVSIEVNGYKELSTIKLNLNNLSFVAGIEGTTKTLALEAISFVFEFLHSYYDERESVMYAPTTCMKVKNSNSCSFTITIKNELDYYIYYVAFKPGSTFCNWPKITKETLTKKDRNNHEKALVNRKGNGCYYYIDNKEYHDNLAEYELAIEFSINDDYIEFLKDEDSDIPYIDVMRYILTLEYTTGSFFDDDDRTSKLISSRKHHQEYYSLLVEKTKELTGLTTFNAHKKKNKHEHTNYKTLEVEKDNYLKGISVFDLPGEAIKIISVLYDIYMANINYIDVLIINDLDHDISPRLYLKLLNAINELNVTTKIIISTSNFEMMKYFNLLLTTFVLVDKNEVVRTKQISKSKLNLFFEDIRNYNLNTKSYLEEILLSDDPLNEFDRYI